MENKGHDEPSKLPYQFLKQITNDFHKNRILGSGGFGTVYKGVLENGGEIAVKVLHNFSGLDDTEFHKEFDNLRGLKHPNIVELVGFCNESEEELVVFEGKHVTAERLRMALCFEYVHNGSLSKHISDECMGFTWHTRYRIIKGICNGLKYLHEGVQSPIMHFDLKPDNILLDKNMMPKIADFGLSKLFGEENTNQMISSVGTCGYWPPEYIKHQIVSREFDIFSLGVIIVKIMTGYGGYNSIVEMTTRKFVQLVHESWRKRLWETLNQNPIFEVHESWRKRLCETNHISIEVYCNQVKRCIEIALDCLKTNRQERPTINDIISSLNETETIIGERGMQNEQVQPH
jgi:serine/threonine protein kinase